MLKVVRERDDDARRHNDILLAAYEADLADYEAAKKKSKGDELLPDRPVRPPAVRHRLQDVTPEDLLSVLADNPKGALMDRDELSGLFGGFGRYSDGKGAVERAKYLSIWSAQPLSDDRKVAKSIHVRRPHLSIFGGIQTDLLFRVVGDDDCAAGLPARLLFGWPPERPRPWSDSSVPRQLMDAVSDVFDQLYELALVERVSRDGQYVDLVAAEIPLTSDARKAFRKWYDEVDAPLVNDASGALRAAFGKLAGYCGRLALVLQLARWAAGEGAKPDVVDIESIRRAITLIEWFRNEARRVYGLRRETAEERDRRELVDLIRRKGGDVTPRDLMRLKRGETSGEAEALLVDLVKHGAGEWLPVTISPTGGRPTQKFRLHPVTQVTKPKTPEKPAISEVVSIVTSVTDPETKNELPKIEPIHANRGVLTI